MGVGVSNREGVPLPGAGRSALRVTGVPVRPGMHVRVVSVELTRTPGEGAGEAPSVLAVFRARAWRTFPCFIWDPAGNPVL